MKFAYNLPIDIALITALYLGFYAGVEAAANIAVVFFWFTVVFGSFGLVSNGVEKLHKKRGPRPPWFKVWDWTTDVVMFALIAGAGYYFLGFFFLLFAMGKQALTMAAEDETAAACS